MKLFYKQDSGYLCSRYPYDLVAEDSDPYIEVDEATYDQTFACEVGKSWAVRDNKLQIVDHLETQSTVEYKKIILNNKILDASDYLSDTDYIIMKLQEAQLEDEDEFQQLKIKYASELAARKEARKNINE